MIIDSSAVPLRTWLESNQRLVHSLEHAITSEESEADLIRKVLINLEEIEIQSKLDSRLFVLNAWTFYILIKRLTTDLQPLKTMLSEKFQYLTLPSDADLTRAALQLTELTLSYQDQVDFSNFAPPFCLNLVPEDFFELGNINYLHGEDDFATVIWMNAALKLSKDSDGITRILEYQAIAYYNLGDSTLALHVIDKILQTTPTHYRSLLNRRHFLRNPNYSVESHNIEKDFNLELFGQFCSRSEMQFQFKCDFFMPNSYYMLRPFKREKLNAEPTVELFHDFIFDNERKLIKEIAEPRFPLIQIEHDRETFTRAALVHSEDHLKILKVYQRVSHATFMDMTQTDPLQVTTYRRGGHYLPHYDFNVGNLNPGLYNEQSGHRIATFLLYVRFSHPYLS